MLLRLYAWGRGDDAIEHYACCAAVWDFSHRHLGRPPPAGEGLQGQRQRTAKFLMLSGEPLGDSDLVKDALRIGSVYFIFHKARHQRPTPPPTVVWEMLPQALRDILHGDPRLYPGTAMATLEPPRLVSPARARRLARG